MTAGDWAAVVYIALALTGLASMLWIERNRP